MSFKELNAYSQRNQYDVLCTIQHPDGRGHLICGALAWERFDRLVNRVIDFEPELARRVSIEQLKKIVIDVFVQYILKEQRGVDLSTSELMLMDAANRAKQSLQTTEHYLPCVLFLNGGPDEFKIGPVTFTRRITFFKNHKQSFRRSIVSSVNGHIEHVKKAIERGLSHERAATPEQSVHYIRGLHARAIKTFRNYPWVATVRLINCDKQVSEERAAKIVETALHVMRIFLGADSTKKLRLAWSRGDALRVAGMWTDADDLIQVSVGSRGIGPVGFENWHDALTQNDGLELQLFGSSLYPLADTIEPIHLHERFIDAISWFGDAATDPEASASVVKYTSAIERLLFGKFHPKTHKKKFIQRVTQVLSAFNYGDVRTNENANKVYNARSELLHGSSSPRGGEIMEQARIAEGLARLCILCAAQIYPMMLKVYGNCGSDQLEEDMDKICKDGIDWLVQMASPASIN